MWPFQAWWMLLFEHQTTIKPNLSRKSTQWWFNTEVSGSWSKKMLQLKKSPCPRALRIIWYNDVLYLASYSGLQADTALCQCKAVFCHNEHAKMSLIWVVFGFRRLHQEILRQPLHHVNNQFITWILEIDGNGALAGYQGVVGIRCNRIGKFQVCSGNRPGERDIEEVT